MKWVEGKLEFDFPDNFKVKKFDDRNHQLSHCMKAVDFIVETDNRIYFIEVKDPEYPLSPQQNRDEFKRKFLSEELDDDIKYKYRDSFLYEWAADNIPQKEKFYLLLMTMAPQDSPLLLSRNDSIKIKLPVSGPHGVWKRNFVDGFLLLNMHKWNQFFPDFHVSRI